jgi:hypothetical protein
MNPYQLLERVNALRDRLANLRGRPLLEDDTSSPVERQLYQGEMLTRRLVRELRLAVANVFDVLRKYGAECDGLRLSALGEATDDHAAEHLYHLLSAAQGMAETVERRERDTAK